MNVFQLPSSECFYFIQLNIFSFMVKEELTFPVMPNKANDI